MSEASNGEELALAREETFKNLGALSRYCECAQMHLEIGADEIARLDIKMINEYFRAALTAWQPLRSAIINKHLAAASKAGVE